MSSLNVVTDAVQTRTEMTIEWKIRDFLSLPDKEEPYFFDSPVFSFADERWHLRLYPYGDTLEETTSDWVSLFLVRGKSGPPKTVYFMCCIKGSDGVKIQNEEDEEEITEFTREDYIWGYGKFWSRADMSERKSTLLPNNVLTVTCDLRCSTPCALKGEDKLLKSLLGMLESGEDSDVTIKVRGKEFLAHRGILRARSPVFRSMFAHDMLEKQNNVVNIEDVDPDAFPAFLVHIYSGSCEQISDENVCSLYTLADKYDVEELKDACAEFMKRNVAVASFCDVIAIALKHEDRELTDCATRFFCDNTADILKTTDWQVFLKENVTVGNELFIKAVSK